MKSGERESEICVIRWRDRIAIPDESGFDPRSSTPEERTFDVLSVDGDGIGRIAFTEFSPRGALADSPWGIVRLTDTKWSLGNRIQCPDGVIVDLVSNLAQTRMRMSVSTGHQYTLRTMPLSWNMSTKKDKSQGVGVLFDGIFDENGQDIKTNGILKGLMKRAKSDKKVAESIAKQRVGSHSSTVASSYYRQWRIITWGRPEPLDTILCSLSLDTAYSVLLSDLANDLILDTPVCLPVAGT